MKNSWPRVECRVTRIFDAEHSLPQVGNPEPHRHSYWLECGYHHEINPIRGVTKSMQEMLVDVDEIVVNIKDKYLNDVMPVTPTAEFLACWVLSQLPEYWDFVIIRAYGGFEARADRKNMTKEWMDRLRKKA
jgi:6-pyruvoyl-tetrahydropterin synthase